MTMSPPPKLETVQDFLDITGGLRGFSPSNDAIQTFTAVKMLMERTNASMIDNSKFEAGHLKKLFALAGAAVPPELTNLNNLSQMPDADLVELPNAVAFELAFDILKKEGCSLLETASIRSFIYNGLKCQ